MRWVFLLFIIMPLTEMLLLFEVAERIGGLTTLGLVVLTAVVGVQILRLQGLSTLWRVNQRLQAGQLPAQEIIEGVLLAVAGAMLLTPGFITDTTGFLLLTPPVRRALAARLLRGNWIRPGAGGSGMFWYGGTRHQEGGRQTYEGDFRREDGPSGPPLDPPGSTRRRE